MSPRVRVYLAAVFIAATLLLALTLRDQLHHAQVLRALFLHYVAWIGICIVSESLCLPAMGGVGTVTMASTAGLASIVLWGQGPACWIAAVSTLVAELFWLRKPLIRASFNAAQITITTWIVAAVFAVLGGPAVGMYRLTAAQFAAMHEPVSWLRHLVPAGSWMIGFRLVPAVLGVFVSYLVINRLLVATVVAWSTERRLRRVLQEDWFYAERLIEDGAAFLLSPLMVLSFQAIGYLGAALFYLPLRMFNESHRRYLDLQKAQLVMIHTERMAAKGEFASGLAHNLNNILVGIKSKAQLIGKDVDRGVYDSIPRHMEVINDAVKRMESLARGIYESTHVELKPERVDLNALVRRVVELVNTSKRFEGVEWNVNLAAQPTELRADPGQLHQVFMNLFANAADAMAEHNGELQPKRLTVSVIRDDRARQVSIRVLDNGPGIPKSNLAKVFEPHFSTKKTGNGFGLYSTYRIIELHKGRITAENVPDAGALFTITLPMQDPASWG